MTRMGGREEREGGREDGKEGGYEPFSCFMTWRLATKSAGSGGTR